MVYLHQCVNLFKFIRTCCGKSNMDWDEFLKIPGCANGSHSDIKPTRPLPRSIDDSKISPVPIPKLSVCSFNNVQAEVNKTEEAPRPQKPWKSDSGLFRCRHAGCQALYDPACNTEDSCEYHPGVATFKDTRKYWPCCEAGSYDWDEFMKIPRCQRGQHEPKMVDA